MKVQIIREKRFAAVGPQGPFTRVFEIGDVLELDEVHALMLIAEGNAKAAPAKAPKVEPKAVKPAAKVKK